MTRPNLEHVLRNANIPTLVMVLFHLTGDHRWLAPPYAPTRAPRLSDHDTGGLPHRIQAEIRHRAADAIAAWFDGKPVALPVPDPALALRMAEVCVGERVPPLYGEQINELLAEPEPIETLPPNDFQVIVVGAGVSGVAMTLRLKQLGVSVRTFERNQRAGGVWADNRYPGAGVDTPSYVYSFSFHRRAWRTHFGKRDEVLDYISEVVDEFGLASDITFNAEVTSAVWDDRTNQWTVTVRHGSGRTEQLTANVVISAVGLLNRPQIPDFPGLDSFQGELFHSARWPDGLDVAGRRVAVVGSGASAMQIVPAIVDSVASLTVFQRSPQWVAPDENYFKPIDSDVHWLIEHVPYYHFWYRFRLNWTFGDRNHASMQIDPTWPFPERSLNSVNDNHRAFFTRYIETQLAGRDDLIAASVPTYPPFGKRMLLDNGWYAALTCEHVRLVTTPIAAITPNGIVDAGGTEHPADVVVMCTGFDPQRPVHPMTVTGRDGVTLAEQWGRDNPRAYLGISAPYFPNLFFLYGPNSNPGGGAVITTVEYQVRYVLSMVQIMIERGLSTVECRPDVHDSYNAALDKAHERMVWSHRGMSTYYRNAAGRVVVNMPWSIVEYWRRLHDPDLADYAVS